MSALEQIETVAVVMLENRSFDHMLGHLSHPAYGGWEEVEGLRPPLERPVYENLHNGEPYYPFEMEDRTLPSDLPHEREEVARQLAYSEVSGTCRMSGFVESYFEYTELTRTRQPDPMGFLPPAEVPVTSFLARNFAVCDRWFSPLPTSTQPNKLMALKGDTHIDSTEGLTPDPGELVVDWLEDQGINWRVYHDGLPFFAVFLRFDDVFGSHSRPLSDLSEDAINEGPEDFPSFILIEPSYGGSPHLGSDRPSDNHAPLAVANGEEFLQRAYSALTANPEVWERTLLIVTYDEHGGFFDHVPPPDIKYEPPSGEFEPFDRMGPRVPAVVASPWVESGTVYSELLDHTSILQLLSERFGSDKVSYSDSVKERADKGIHSVAEVLNRDSPRADIPPPPEVDEDKLCTMEEVQEARERDVEEPIERTLREAALRCIEEHPDEVDRQYPRLMEWYRQEQA